MDNPNLLIILTGKTAAGKDTVIARILSRLPGFKKIITTTSRTRREGEKNGVDYNFVSREDFQQKIARGDFFEHVEYGGNFYGTEKTQLESPSNQGLIWKIDPSRAGRIKKLINRPTLVIYLTVNDSVVLERLKQRGFSQAEIEKRMTEDKQFWQEYQDNYDVVIENTPGKLEETVDKIIQIIENHHS